MSDLVDSVPNQLSSSGSIEALVPQIEPLPWEDKAQHDALTAAVLKDLAPVTPHEQVVAKRIAECHWDLFRSRAIARDVFVSAYRKAALGMLNTDFLAPMPSAADRDFVDRLLSRDPSIRNPALSELSVRGITEEGIRAQAYLDHQRAIEALERRPGTLDDRRAELMKEYEALKASSHLDKVPEAEVIAAHDD